MSAVFRYSSSQVLTELYRSVEAITKNRVSYLGEPFLCHGYLALVVSNWCHGPMRTALLGNASLSTRCSKSFIHGLPVSCRHSSRGQRGAVSTR